MKKNSAEPVLERLVAEVRREPLPDLDWDDVEESLFARLGEAPRFAKVQQSRSRSPFVLVLAAAAVAGVAAAAVGVMRHEAPEATKVLAAEAPAAEKVPRRRGAVNGNTVAEGVVGVGPLGGPSFDVAAPDSALTTLDGVRADRRHAARSAVTRGEAHAQPGAAENAEAAFPEKAAPAVPEPVAEEEETELAPPEGATSGAPQVAGRAPRASSSAPSIEGVVAAVRRCFRDRTVASGDLHVSVSTQMSVRIQPSGRVGEAVFTPPLAPGVRRCVDETVGSLSFRSSADGFAVDRVLELER